MMYLTKNDLDDLRIAADRLDYDAREQFRVLIDAYADLERLTTATDLEPDGIVAALDERSGLELKVEDLTEERDYALDEKRHAELDRKDLREGIDLAVKRLHFGTKDDALKVLEAL